MVSGAILEHHRDATAILLKGSLNRRCKLQQERIDRAADEQNRNVGPRKIRQPTEAIVVAAGIVGVDGGDLVRMSRSPR